MSTIVTACVAACLASYKVDQSRYTRLALGLERFRLSTRPDDSEIELLRTCASYWSLCGVHLETPSEDLLLDDLHQHDFICLKPNDVDQKLQQVAQIKQISGRGEDRIFLLENYRRKVIDGRKIEPTGEVHELISRDRTVSRCWADEERSERADFITSAKVETCKDCANRRKLRQFSKRKLRKLKVLSLFGGAGGMDLGLSELSYRTQVMIDSDKASCETFRKHHPMAQVIQADVGQALRDGMIDHSNCNIDVIVMGPPCQSFSKLNRQDRQTRAADPRSLCVATGLSYVEVYKPTYGIIENVLGMLENGDLGIVAKNGIVKFILQCLATLVCLVGVPRSRFVYADAPYCTQGYNVRLCTLRSNAFGVPQKRKRLCFLFAKSDVTMPPAPIGDYSTHSVPSKYSPVSVFDAFSDLPRWEVANPRRYAPRITSYDSRPFYLTPRSYSLNREGQVNGPLWCNYGSTPQNHFQSWIRRGGSGQVQQHYLLPPLADPLLTAERVCHIPFRKKANHLALIPIPSLAISEVTDTLDDAVFADAFGRLDPEGQFATITTDINLRGKSGRMLMPDQNRVPSIRELARVQGFPDGITFCGTPSEIMRQIGNAVPGPLAHALGESIMRAVSTDYLNGDLRFARRM